MAARTSGVLAANFLTGQIDPEAVATAAARAVEPVAQVIKSWCAAAQASAG